MVQLSSSEDVCCQVIIKIKMVIQKNLFLILIFVIVSNEASKIKISSDGGYGDIVIKIEENVSEDDCPQILSDIEVRKYYMGVVVAYLYHLFTGPTA